MTSVWDLPADMLGKVRTSTAHDCWEWTASRNNKGYGCASAGNSRTMLAHRKSYAHFNGPIPEGMTVDHICEVKRCINPTHLQVVTAALNAELVGVRERARFEAEHPPRLGPTGLPFSKLPEVAAFLARVEAFIAKQ